MYAYRHTAGIIIVQIYIYINTVGVGRWCGLPIVCFKSSTCDDGGGGDVDDDVGAG